MHDTPIQQQHMWLYCMSTCLVFLLHKTALLIIGCIPTSFGYNCFYC